MENQNLTNPTTGEQVDPQVTTLEEGLYYERTFAPIEISITYDECEECEGAGLIFGVEVTVCRTCKGRGGRNPVYTLEDIMGKKLELTNNHAQTHIRHFYWLYRGKLMGELSDHYSSMQGDLQMEMNLVNEEEPKVLKFLHDGETYRAVCSLKHKQISWSDIDKAIQGAAVQAFGFAAELETEESRTGFYKMPVDSKYVSLWTKIHAGNNLKQGASAISISTMARTEFDTFSGGKRPACHNWANVWTTSANPEIWKNVKFEHLEDAVAQEFTPLSSIEIHLQDTEISPDVFVEPFRLLKDTAEQLITPLIERGLQTSLSKEEMGEILNCYQAKKGLPEYIVDMILDSVEGETVWGFSQAVSWVRTHEELKGRGTRMRGVLEKIAGEIYSLTPTIQNFHDQHGPITYEKLLGAESNPYRKKSVDVVATPSERKSKVLEVRA